MTVDALYLFVFAGLFSPGPNVILLLASGVRFGLWRTLPHVFGVAAGVGITAGATGFGIAAFLQQFPLLALGLSALSAAWIFWMAFQLYSSARLAPIEGKDRPFTFIQAVLFQWINPKVWAVALAAAGGFTSNFDPEVSARILATAFSSVNLGVCLFYATLGSILARWLQNGLLWRVFNGFLCGLLAFSGLLVLFYGVT
ncbi:MAG: LysE family translocator [Pseudomonadota bacterium]